MKETIHWKPLQRDIRITRAKLQKACTRSIVEEHPLSSAFSATPQDFTEKHVDPLSDPLTAFSRDPLLHKRKSSDFTPDQLQVDVSSKELQIDREWRIRSSAALSKYQTTKRIVLRQSEADEYTDEKQGAETISRADALDPDNISETMLSSIQSQSDFEAMMDASLKEIKDGWTNGERVKTLKHVIRIVGLLENGSVGWFYPFKFIHVVKVLDLFSDLVDDRLCDLGLKDPLQRTWTSKDLNENAKSTCRNWTHKVSCIPKLLPRLLLELSLIRCVLYLDGVDVPKVLLRIAQSIRGIADPMVSSFLRMYLATQVKRAQERTNLKSSAFREVLMSAMDDSMAILDPFLSSNSNLGLLVVSVDSKEEFAEIIEFPMSWITFQLSSISNDTSRDGIVEQYSLSSNKSFFLYLILNSFPSNFVAKSALKMSALIASSESKAFRKYKLYAVFGHRLIESAPSSQIRLKVLNTVWKFVSRLANPKEYITVSKIFIQYILLYFGSRELNIFAKDLIKHMKHQQAFRDHQEDITFVIQKIIEAQSDFKALLALDYFLPMMDLIVDLNSKRFLSLSILKLFADSNEKVSDAVLLNALFDVAKALHDSIDRLSIHSDSMVAERLVANFVGKIHLGHDLESHLNKMVECRAAFPNFDTVAKVTVEKVDCIALTALHFMNGNHNRDTFGFVKACMAYCFITIPSFRDPWDRVRYFLHSSQVSLSQGLVGQAEAMLKVSIGMLIELEYDAVKAYDWVSQCIGLLLMFPGDVKKGPFFLIKGLLKALESWDPFQSDVETRFDVHKQFLRLFSALGQNVFPFHLPNVKSNDSLFGSTKEYRKELSALTAVLIEDTLEAVADMENPVTKAEAALSLAQCIIQLFEMDKHVAVLIVKLFRLGSKQNAVNPRIRSIISSVKEKDGEWYRNLETKLVAD